MTADLTPGTPQPQRRGPDPHDAEGITFVDVLSILLRHRWWVIVPTLVFMLLLGLRAALAGAGDDYQASSTFVSDSRAQSDGGNALARQLGLSQAGTSTSTGSPGYYAALARSRPLLRDVVVQPYRVVAEGDTIQGTLLELWGIQRTTEEAARRAAAGRLANNVETRVDRNTGFVTLTVQAERPELAEQIATQLVAAVQRYNVEEHRNRASDEARFLSEQINEAQRELSVAQDSLASFLQRNRRIGPASELQFEQERLQRQVELRQEFLLSLVRSLERLRMEQARDMPVIRVVETAQGSAVPAPGGSPLPMAALGLVLGGVVGVLLAFLAEFFRRVRTGTRSDYAELRALLAEILAGPGRLARRLRRGRREAVAVEGGEAAGRPEAASAGGDRAAPRVTAGNAAEPERETA